MGVKVLIVALVIMVTLQKASAAEEMTININMGESAGGQQSYKSQYTAGAFAELLKQGGDTEGDEGGTTDSQLGQAYVQKLFQDMSGNSQLGTLDMTDMGQDMVIALMLGQMKDMQAQNKEMQGQLKDLTGQVKNLTLDLCLTKKTCCNKTLTCPSGYERFCEKPDMCYKFSTDEKNYADARSACQAAGGSLAMPKDQATNDFLRNQLTRYPSGSDAWFGLTDLAQEGTWVWEDGTPLTGWSNWAPGEPNGGSAENCAHWHGSYGYKWNDRRCSHSQYYVCEVSAAVP
ncbi:low affinity immunoglobulin epsilon Fc receptor-like [Branchiostoma floridae]|uniref:Low affinity immunoglobulin epsilon Fc receptor-like n=1 Tax=Branchiostoma floridae TaxID=7739 RepID=A0A9J7M7Z9_BRAFL|nr:low affinity immunoglobulin epsilon Fc receptor-like [Branchiostoma floridae]